MPTNALDIDTILSELGEDSRAWVLEDKTSGKFVIIPDARFPGRHPVRFFMREQDAQDHLVEILDVNPKLRNKEIYPKEVRLLPALRGIAEDRTPGNADSFVVHSPNEVYEYLADQA